MTRVRRRDRVGVLYAAYATRASRAPWRAPREADAAGAPVEIALWRRRAALQRDRGLRALAPAPGDEVRIARSTRATPASSSATHVPQGYRRMSRA